MFKRILQIIIALVVFSTIYGGMNYYVYHSFTSGLFVNGLALYIIQLSFWLLGTAYIAGQMLKGKMKLPMLTYLGAVWMGVLSISVSVFILKDLSLWVFGLETDLYTISVGLIATMIFWSVYKVSNGPKTKQVSIRHRKLDKNPLNIVHLADIHLGTMTSDKWLSKTIRNINNLQADVIVITGDMVDGSFETVKRFAPTMASLKARYGTFAVAGNHEFYQGLEHFNKFCEAANIKVLNNEAVSVADKINLIGIDDQLVKNKGLYEKVEELLTTNNEGLYNILLLHQPVGFRKMVGMGVDLQLSGHTHRGQLPPLNLFVPLVYRYAYGLHSHGASHIYTTSGTGTWGPPMRLFSKCEIVNIKVG